MTFISMVERLESDLVNANKLIDAQRKVICFRDASIKELSSNVEKWQKFAGEKEEDNTRLRAIISAHTSPPHTDIWSTVQVMRMFAEEYRFMSGDKNSFVSAAAEMTADKLEGKR